MQPTTRVKRDLALRDVLEMLRRQRAAVIVMFIICLAVSGVAYKLTSATYRTNTSLLVQSHSAAGGGERGDPVSQALAPASDLDIPTQVQVLQSPLILRQIFDEAGLGTFNESDPDIPKIHAAQILETNVISLSVEAPNPATATKVAGSLGKVYNAYLVGLRQENLRKALTFLHDRYNRYRNEFVARMKEVDDFRNKRKLPALYGEETSRSARVTQTEAEFTQANAAIAAQETRIASLKENLATLPKVLAHNDDRPNDNELETQRALLANLESQRASLLTKWKDGTSPIKEIDAQIKTQQERLAAIPTRIQSKETDDHPRILALQGEIADAKILLSAMKVSEQHASSAWHQAANELKEFSKLAPKQSILGGAANDSKTNMDNASKMIEELEIQRNATTDGGAQLSLPTPTEKVRPLIGQYLAIAILAGVVLGLGVALVKDHIEDRVTSPQDVFQICGLEPLAQMPTQPALAAPGSTALARHQANPALFDSYRLLRFNLLNAAERGYMGSLVVTSVTGAEGKSDLACDLAEVMASGGRRIILVDANLRNPTLAGHFGLSERPGLTDVLVGDASLSDALLPTHIEGLRVLPAGAKTPNPVDLLESSQMVSLHGELRELADLVIFDAPSCLSFADVSVLSSFTDSVLVVAELGSTKRDLLNRGVQMLQRSSARLIGVVLRDRQLTRRSGRRKAA